MVLSPYDFMWFGFATYLMLNNPVLAKELEPAMEAGLEGHGDDIAAITCSNRATYGQPGSPSGSWARRVPNPLDVLEPVLKRHHEAELVFVADNIALVAFDIIESVAVLTLAAHVMARSRFKALQGAAELLEEADSHDRREPGDWLISL